MHRGAHHRLPDLLDFLGIRQVNRIADLPLFSGGHLDFVDHARVGGNDVEVVFAANTLQHDLHVK